MAKAKTKQLEPVNFNGEDIMGTIQPSSLVATDAVVVVFEAIGGIISQSGKWNYELRALLEMLWAAIEHYSPQGGTPETKQAFYNRVARIACSTDLKWKCTLTPELLQEVDKRADDGFTQAKQIQARLREAQTLNPVLKLD